MKHFIMLVVILLSSCDDSSTIKNSSRTININNDFYSSVKIYSVCDLRQKSKSDVFVVNLNIQNVSTDVIFLPKQFDHFIKYEVWKDGKQIAAANKVEVMRSLLYDTDSSIAKDDFPSKLDKNEKLTSWVVIRYGIKNEAVESIIDPFSNLGETFDCDFDVTKYVKTSSQNNIFEVRMISPTDGFLVSSAYINIIPE